MTCAGKTCIFQITHSSMFEVVHVDIVARFRVAMRKLIHIARELIVSHHFIESIPIGHRVIWIQPIGVLEDDGLTGRRPNIWVKFCDCPQELLPTNWRVTAKIKVLGEALAY